MRLTIHLTYCGHTIQTLIRKVYPATDRADHIHIPIDAPVDIQIKAATEELIKRLTTAKNLDDQAEATKPPQNHPKKGA